MGGAIVIPEDVILSGAYFLKPIMDIELQQGAVFIGATKIVDYPRMNTHIEDYFEPRTADSGVDQ